MDDPLNESDKLQNAIDATASRGGGVVQLPPGQFTVNSPLIMKDKVALTGSGPDTVLKAGPHFLDNRGPYGGHPLITTGGANDTTISNLTTDQSGEDLNGNTDERLNEYMIDVRYSDNTTIDGVSTRNPFSYSIAVVGSTRFTVKNSRTVAATSDRYDQLDGIHILDSSFGTVMDNIVDQRRGSDGDDGLVLHSMGAPVHDVVFYNNKVRGGRHGSGIQLAVGNYEIYNIFILENTIWGSPNGIQTGYYDGIAGIHDVAIVGNIFQDNDNLSVRLSGALTNVTVTGNSAIRSGSFNLEAGAGNKLSNNSW